MNLVDSIFFDFQIYFNFFTIGSIIPLIFNFLVGLFLLSIPKKSKASFQLGIGFILMATFQTGYLFAAAVYHPIAAYHRWVTVAFILPAISHFSHIFFVYPKEVYPKTRRTILAIQWIVAIFITGLFIVKTANAKLIYHFDGHYWDFAADNISEVVAIIIFLYILSFLGVALWRFFTLKSSDRWTILFMFLSFFVASVLPAIANIYSRAGLLDRGTYQNLLDLMTVLGFFALVIVYINTTTDKTTFIAKIVGISLASFLLVLQGLSYFSLQDKDESYNLHHRSESARVIETKYRSNDFRYLLKYNFDTDEVNLLEQKNSKLLKQVEYKNLKNDFLNTFLLEKIKLETEGDYLISVKNLLENSHEKFSAYKLELNNFLNQNAKKSKLKKLLLEHLNSLKTTTLYNRKKIEKIPAASFRKEIINYLQNSKSNFKIISSVLLEKIKSSNLKKEALKKEVLSYIAVINNAGERLYRTSKNGFTHFTAFTKVDLQNKSIMEVGYSYRDYRKFVHPATFRLLIMLLVVLFVVLIGFQFFFRGALVIPLAILQHGVSEVNKGNLDIEVPVKVEDEIGSLAHGFNKMVLTIKDARQKLLDHADKLEDTVTQRTSALQTTLEEVKDLKKSQDGDYFLTSLLLKPLGSSEIQSDTITIETLLRQKKKFEFRNWKEEIGGDLCKAATISLRESKYTVFLNADAMGKSMQGAGGALVLGAVFGSMLERTKMSPVEMHKFPERWLKDAFTELQKVFESFDGSMLISIVMGLVEDRTGLMYYINAEHPWTIVYRDGKASFIENELLFRKLGTQGVKGIIYVQTFNLIPGDVILAGSDGRDDILLGTNDGIRVINEDENLILGVVEDAKSNLVEIEKRIQSLGDITDDLSFIRVAFKEKDNIEELTTSKDILNHLKNASFSQRKKNWKEAIHELELAYNIDNYNADVLKNLVKAYLNNTDYNKAAELAEDYIFLRPGDSDFLYISSYCYKLAGKLDKAAEIGERLRLRDPKMINNLINLADIHALLKNNKWAMAMVEDVLRLEKENKKALEIKKKLESITS